MICLLGYYFCATLIIWLGGTDDMRRWDGAGSDLRSGKRCKSQSIAAEWLVGWLVRPCCRTLEEVLVAFASASDLKSGAIVRPLH